MVADRVGDRRLGRLDAGGGDWLGGRGGAAGRAPTGAGGAAFALLGAGMAAPHALLAAFPKLLAKLPAPGLWMERLKQAMGFVLLAVAAWLITVLGFIGTVYGISSAIAGFPELFQTGTENLEDSLGPIT